MPMARVSFLRTLAKSGMQTPLKFANPAATRWTMPLVAQWTVPTRHFAAGHFFAKSHEYAVVDESDPTSATVGVTSHAIELLGEVVFVALPEIGSKLTKDEPFCQIESVKAVGDVYAPVSGEVIAVNEDIVDVPVAINESPESDGWLVKVKVSEPSKVGDGLMTAEDYKTHCQES